MRASVPLSTAQADFFPEVDVRQPTDRSVKFEGTDDPYELRAIALLLRRPSVSRESLDSEVGCANGGELISRLRAHGLGDDHFPCSTIEVIGRDECKCDTVVYWLTAQGRRAVLRWLRKRQQGARYEKR